MKYRQLGRTLGHAGNFVPPWKSVIIENYFTLARIRCFAIFGRTGGLVRPPPWRFQTKRRRALRKILADCSRRVLAIGCIIFGPRWIFDPVMAGQRSIFENSMIFQLYESISATIFIVAAWNLHQRVPRSILHIMRCFDASRLNI